MPQAWPLVLALGQTLDTHYMGCHFRLHHLPSLYSIQLNSQDVTPGCARMWAPFRLTELRNRV